MLDPKKLQNFSILVIALKKICYVVIIFVVVECITHVVNTIQLYNLDVISINWLRFLVILLLKLYNMYVCVRENMRDIPYTVYNVQLYIYKNKNSRYHGFETIRMFKLCFRCSHYHIHVDLYSIFIIMSQSTIKA